MTIVMKFGGSSIADAASMRQVARLIADRIDAGPLVVLSAMGKTTDALFDAARLAEDDQLDAALDIAATLRGQHGEVTDLLFDGATPPRPRESRRATVASTNASCRESETS